MRDLIRSSLACLLLSVAATGCGDDIDSDEEARRAYLGLDRAIEKAITLGFQGFNAAQSANIDPQAASGEDAGKLTVTGQVDQGASMNKGMRLSIGMSGYDDGDVEVDEGETIHIVYDTDPAPENQPYLELQLKGIPAGTLEGRLTSNSKGTGVFHLSGDMEGELTLDLTIQGSLQPGEGETVQRVPGSTTVTGTATNGDGGTYEIDLKI